MIHVLLHVLGVDDVSGPFYAFWSGFGSDLSEITGLAAVAYLFWRKHNCHELRCWRIGRYPIGNTGYVVCRRHHPRAVAR